MRPKQTQDPNRVLLALRLGSVVAPAAIAIGFGALTWHVAVNDAWKRAEDNAQIIAEYAQRLVSNQEQVIAAGEEALRSFSSGEGQGQGQGREIRAAVQRFLAGLYARAGGGIGVVLISSEGERLLSSATAGQQWLPGQPALRALAADSDRPGLMIDRVRLEPGDIDAMIVARRNVFAPEGLWVAAFDAAAIRGFLRDVATAPDDAASLSRPDGKLLIRNLPLEAPIMLPPDSPPVAGARSAERGVARVTSAADGVTRLHAWDQVGDLDLIANFGVATRTIRAEWLRRFAPVVGLLTAIGAAGFVATLYAGRAVRAEAGRAAAEFDRALLAEAEKTARLRATMMRELNHRVKNSLQMIRSLIRLQKARPEGPDLDEIGTRVLAIAEIHDLLYRSSDAFNVDFAALIGAISRSEALAPPERGVALRCDAVPLSIDANLATPLALCAVELVTNAVKHAFGPEGGRVRLGLERDGEEARLIVEDDGAGIGAAATRRSGLRVVDALVMQIRGRVEATSGPGGTRYVIVFHPSARGEENGGERDGEEER